MKTGIEEGRRRIEEELRVLLGNIFVPEAKLFSMACGCIGFSSDIRGLQKSDVEIFREKISEILEEISQSIGIEPEFIYARSLPGTEEVVALTARELCGGCKKELSSSKSAPRPDVVVLKKK